MSNRYNGKRKGISLVEMTIAVILFGVLSTIAMLYYKSLFNIDLTAKKARVAALMDQAYQLSGAYDVFVAQQGVAPTVANLSEFNATNVMILRSLPRDIREMTTTGWELNTSAVNGRPAFQFPIDLNGTGGWDVVSDDDFYCAIFNHEINKSVELNVTNDMNFGSVTTQHTRYGDTFCYSQQVGAHYKHWIMIVK
ncbi:MAG: prepilin-type cleavage/methylation domain-containing protein [Sulfuricurvum sp. PD_MW2]|jgi:prepilin-type N-terminal cleavage/methylation domain-containing protein|uniref:type II secretion system protein n=1 Tax=Sulfuricurvum sp. PD_MW2 TaxID=2027917 RepID=UPI000C0615E4|nr:prepilin-type N-terminal cleavage/methylation domain-containing protein [Sulfuricurvum sp. PD_MW2]PHM18621.1 MAG: prepilin-type cleavage/methylation domain-containing protein [Sulfuricurvum sp. PD_MW2]